MCHNSSFQIKNIRRILLYPVQVVSGYFYGSVQVDFTANIFVEIQILGRVESAGSRGPSATLRGHLDLQQMSYLVGQPDRQSSLYQFSNPIRPGGLATSMGGVSWLETCSQPSFNLPGMR
jgi:hypothetical protein